MSEYWLPILKNRLAEWEKKEDLRAQITSSFLNLSGYTRTLYLQNFLLFMICELFQLE